MNTITTSNAIFSLGIELGYSEDKFPDGDVPCVVILKGANGMSIVRLPPGYCTDMGWIYNAVIEADGSLVTAVCQDYLQEISAQG